MFINKLIQYNKEKLSQYNLVFKHIKGQSLLFLLTIIISSISFVWLIAIREFWYILLPAITYVLSIYCINKCIKKTILRIHNINIHPFKTWNGWTEYKVKLLKIFLEQNNCMDKKKIKIYSEFLEKEAMKIKPSNYFIFGVPGLLLALFIPVWNHFNGWVYNHLVTTLEIGVIYIIIILIIIFLISFFIGMLRVLASDYFESNYRRLKELNNLLELVMISLDEPIIDKSIINRLE